MEFPGLVYSGKACSLLDSAAETAACGNYVASSVTSQRRHDLTHTHTQAALKLHNWNIKCIHGLNDACMQHDTCKLVHFTSGTDTSLNCFQSHLKTPPALTEVVIHDSYIRSNPGLKDNEVLHIDTLAKVLGWGQ
jgi:hypothetical protein